MAVGEDVLHAEHDVLARVDDQFDDLAAAFRGTRTPLRGHVEAIRDGAGELAGALDAGATAFGLSWDAVLGVLEQTAGLVAGNVGRLSVDLEAVDVDASTSITL
ncbi:hypothetical protein GCM10009756_03830 [Pseudokineococcus marinus]